MKQSSGLFVVLGMLIFLPAFPQNLVQNPSFESATRWDEFWILSTTAPSSATAIATEITTDAHEGLKSVELSNTVFNKWTYFYSDAVNAPIPMLANKSYEVRTWMRSVEAGKGTDISFIWNGGLDILNLYTGNPDPVTDPGWFMVVDTVTPVADYSDGYFSLGFWADKIAPNTVVGKLLFDDFSVVRIPDINKTDILAFSIPQQTGPAIIDKLAGTIEIEVPLGTDVTALIPDLITLSRGATVSPAAGVAADFTNPVIYTVTAQDEVTTRDWIVTVVFPPSIETDIISFTLTDQTAPATINATNHTVAIEVFYGTDVTALVPVIALSAGASVVPASGIATDFSAPVIYAVTAEDGVTIQNWTVTVAVAPPSNATNILSFVLPEQTGPANIDNVLHNVIVIVAFATDLTALIPDIKVSRGATIAPPSGVVNDFNSPLIYTVTAENGITKQNYIVAVMASSVSNLTDIISFSLAEQASPAVIDKLGHTVTIDVKNGTDMTALLPVIGVSAGATVSPASGVMTDFTSTVVYKVTAEDGTTTQDWTVKVVELPSSATDITAFSVIEQDSPAVIDNLLHTITFNVPYGTFVSALVPTLGLSAGATVVPASGVAADFTSFVLYRVTAEDGVTTRDWTASVNILPNTETEIVSFSMTEQYGPATIDNLLHTITIEVPYGTDVTSLVPTIGLSAGATVIPASDLGADFNSPVIYTVTAEDGVTTMDWTATVNVLLNTATEILSFSLGEQAGPAEIDNLLHSVTIDVPYGTDVTSLVPAIGLSAGATVNPASGVTADFNSPVIYTVTAGDGATTQDWTATVVILPNNETEIVSFSMAGQAAPPVIDNLLFTINIDMPYGTDVTALIPTIGLSAGATVLPASDVATDFSSPVVYTVTAEDGTTTRDWTATVALLPNTATDIISFSLREQTGPAAIDPTLKEISIEVTKETDVSSLVPDIRLSPGATIAPASGVAVDFSTPVIFKVTAEDGVTTADWSATVTLDPAVFVEEGRVPSWINIYPNPATEFLNIELSRSGDLYLRDIVGRVVRVIHEASAKTTIPVSELDRGIYFMEFRKGDSIHTTKLILE